MSPVRRQVRLNWKKVSTRSWLSKKNNHNYTVVGW